MDKDFLIGSHKYFANWAKFSKQETKHGAEIMNRIFLVLACALTLNACGTARGVMNGVGEVLSGMGNDARSIGNSIN